MDIDPQQQDQRSLVLAAQDKHAHTWTTCRLWTTANESERHAFIILFREIQISTYIYIYTYMHVFHFHYNSRTNYPYIYEYTYIYIYITVEIYIHQCNKQTTLTRHQAQHSKVLLRKRESCLKIQRELHNARGLSQRVHPSLSTSSWSFTNLIRQRGRHFPRQKDTL